MQEVDETRSHIHHVPMHGGWERVDMPPQIISEPVEEPRRPETPPEPVIQVEKKAVQRAAKPTQNKPKMQRSAPAPPPPPQPQPQIVEVEKIVYVDKVVEVQVVEEVIEYVDKIVYKDVIKYTNVEVPEYVDRRVEVPVPYEKIVHVEVPVERIVYREVPVPIYGEEKVIVKEVTVPVEVIREVAVPVEHIVTKEVHVPVEIGTRSETRVGETRMVIGEETRASIGMTSDHLRSNAMYSGPTSVGNVSGFIGGNLGSVYSSQNVVHSGIANSSGNYSFNGQQLYASQTGGSHNYGQMSPGNQPMSGSSRISPSLGALDLGRERI